jgi:hypothetical protein
VKITTTDGLYRVPSFRPGTMAPTALRTSASVV